MRVLYVLRYYPTLTETFVYREIAGVVGRGHPVEAIAIGPRDDGALQDEPPPITVARPPSGLLGIELASPVVRAWAKTAGRWAWGWLRKHLRAKDAARAVWLAQHARDAGVDRLHAHFAGEAAEWAFAASTLTGIPFSVTVHAADLFKPRPSLPEVLQAARPVITVAEHHRALIRERYGVDAKVVRCGVEPTRYRLANPGKPGPMRVIAVGRDVPKKGLDDLAAAIDAAPFDVGLRLVSDATHASMRIDPGPLPPSEIPGELARSQLFALPCKVADDGDQDGIPLALVEAMAAGLPVLTTDVSGIPELVDESVGWVVPPGDREAIGRALAEAAASPAERARRGANGRKRVVERGFTVDSQVSGLLAAWQSAG